MINIMRLTIFLITIFFIGTNVSISQILAPTGTATRASSQMIYYYDQTASESPTGGDDTAIQITNTNDTTGVWIHVQIFRSFDTDDGNNMLDLIICDERNFIDFLTPNDTHVYDLEEPNFPKNIGETEFAGGESTSITVDDSLGFVVITPVVSEADLSAISFQHLIGQSMDDDENILVNAMGRDAVDFTTGDIVPQGTPLDGVNNGYLVLQPEELLFSFAGDVNPANTAQEFDVMGIVFQDSYGDPGLLGYQVIPGAVSWNPFIFDFKEDVTSCGVRPVECFLNVGLNDTFTQDEGELNDTGDILLCAGSETPEYDDMGVTSHNDPVDFGWTRIFVSGLDDFENHLGIGKSEDYEGALWMYTKGERTEIDPEPVDEVCDDEIDNDEDGFTDCEDSDCNTDEACETGTDECTDGEDNDGDGDTDCADLGCDGTVIDSESGAVCETGGETSCNDGFDNDGDGAVDGNDTDCQAADTGGTGGDGDGGGCVVTGTVSTSSSVVNILVLMLPFIGVFGIRRIRKRN